MLRKDPRAYVKELLESDAKCGLAVASLLCPSQVFDRAVAIADNEQMISQTEIGGTSCFVVKASTRTGGRYVVVPRKFCSCPYYSNSVIKDHISWTCKHDLAVQLRLAVAGTDSVPLAREGDEPVRQYFAT